MVSAWLPPFLVSSAMHLISGSCGSQVFAKRNGKIHREKSTYLSIDFFKLTKPQIKSLTATICQSIYIYIYQFSDFLCA